MAERLIDSAGTLNELLAGAPATVLRVIPEREDVARQLAVVHAAMVHVLGEPLSAGVVIADHDLLHAYLQVSFGTDHAEHFRVLFLNRGNRLIADETLSIGTVDHAVIYPREVVKRALELGATALILVHNHPSGNATPSRQDREATRAICDAARTLDIRVHDHIVVGRDSVVSFRTLGLL